jgi:hypothetical protein
MNIGRPMIVKGDWKKVFEPENAKQQIAAIA